MSGRYTGYDTAVTHVFPQADYIMLESTYGNSLHELTCHHTRHALLGWIEKPVFSKKGKLIMPAFSVGRTQELLFALNQLELEKASARR